jgi:hypothetical protein
MVGVPFHLGGPAHVALDEHALGVAAVDDRGGEEERPAGDHVLGRHHVGDDLLLGLPRAPGEPREGQRSPHHLQEAAAALGVVEGAGLLGELAVQELQELRRAGQLLQALPVDASGGIRQAAAETGEVDRPLRAAGIRAHRWHVEQAVRV